MNITQSQNNNGFVAIISAIIISALLIIITATLSYSGFFVRFNVLESEYKKTSVGYAATCVEAARIYIANTLGYSASDLQQDLDAVNPGNECKLTVIANDPNYVIKAQSNFKNSVTNLEVVVVRDTGLGDVTISSWKEVSNF